MSHLAHPLWKGCAFFKASEPTTSAGSPVDLVGFDTLGDNATVRLADGSTVPFSQVAVANPSMAAIYEVAKTFQGVGEANAFIQIYQKSGLGAADFIDLYTNIYLASIENKNSAASDAQGMARVNRARVWTACQG